MKKLEYYILKIFQDMMVKENFDSRYILLEDNLLCLIKPKNELDLFVKTELILDGRTLNTFRFDKVVDGLYKITWTDVFLYIVGNKNIKDIPYSVITKELELIKVSSNPLSNYIKTI
jgi:hypothetical protein